MKAVIAIMSANNTIAERNIKAQQETFIKKLFDRKRLHDYTVVFYAGGNDELTETKLSENVFLLKCTSEDDIRHTFEKTCEAYEYILKTHECDMFIRCNISCYINVDLLDAVLQSTYDKNYIIANRFNLIINAGDFLNKPYPRGDFYMLRTEWIKGALSVKDGLFNADSFSVDPVDDTQFGMCLMKYNKRQYIDSIHFCAYCFLPYQDIDDMHPIFLTARCKTIPPDVDYSGYFWSDEEIRKWDADKMHLLYSKFQGISTESFSSKGVTIDSCILKDTDVQDMIAGKFYVVTFDAAKKALK